MSDQLPRPLSPAPCFPPKDVELHTSFPVNEATLKAKFSRDIRDLLDAAPHSDYLPLHVSHPPGKHTTYPPHFIQEGTDVLALALGISIHGKLPLLTPHEWTFVRSAVWEKETFHKVCSSLGYPSKPFALQHLARVANALANPIHLVKELSRALEPVACCIAHAYSSLQLGYTIDELPRAPPNYVNPDVPSRFASCPEPGMFQTFDDRVLAELEGWSNETKAANGGRVPEIPSKSPLDALAQHHRRSQKVDSAEVPGDLYIAVMSWAVGRSKWNLPSDVLQDVRRILTLNKTMEIMAPWLYVPFHRLFPRTTRHKAYADIGEAHLGHWLMTNVFDGDCEPLNYAFTMVFGQVVQVILSHDRRYSNQDLQAMGIERQLQAPPRSSNVQPRNPTGRTEAPINKVEEKRKTDGEMVGNEDRDNHLVKRLRQQDDASRDTRALQDLRQQVSKPTPEKTRNDSSSVEGRPEVGEIADDVAAKAPPPARIQMAMVLPLYQSSIHGHLAPPPGVQVPFALFLPRRHAGNKSSATRNDVDGGANRGSGGGHGRKFGAFKNNNKMNGHSNNFKTNNNNKTRQTNTKNNRKSSRN